MITGSSACADDDARVVALSVAIPAEITPYVAARAPVPPAARFAADRDCVRRRDPSGPAAPPRPGAALYLAGAGRDPHRRVDHAAARQREGGARLRGAQWRLDRGAPEAVAASHSVC